MWIRANPNPKGKHVVDCVVRAVSIATGLSWYETYDWLYLVGREDCNMPSADDVWGHFLMFLGFRQFILPDVCPPCTTVARFADIYWRGTYIIGTGSHAVAVIDGDYYDDWDSGNQVPSFFWWRIGT